MRFPHESGCCGPSGSSRLQALCWTGAFARPQVLAQNQKGRQQVLHCVREDLRRHEKDPRPGSRKGEGGAGRAVSVIRKRLCKAAKRSKRLGVIRRHTKKASSPTAPTLGLVAALGRQARVSRPPACNASDRSLRMPVCPKADRCVTSSIALRLPTMWTPLCRPGSSASNGGLSSGTTWMNFNARACAGLDVEPRAAP